MRTAWVEHTKTDRGTIWLLRGEDGKPVLDAAGERVFKHTIEKPSPRVAPDDLLPEQVGQSWRARWGLEVATLTVGAAVLYLIHALTT